MQGSKEARNVETEWVIVESTLLPPVEATPLGHAEGALPDFEEAESQESLSLLSRIVLDHRNTILILP